MTHEEMLQAVLDKKQLQRQVSKLEWVDLTNDRVLELLVFIMREELKGQEFRIKPESKPDVTMTFTACNAMGIGNVWTRSGDPNVIVVFDGERGVLKSVRMIGKPCPEKMEAALRIIASCGNDESIQYALEALK